ncbi:hypothetical protein [Streptomyces winkii]|uniref:hypothetical protein n=1 Tax=Streptomyces winkii TaxID=3051178 RepID=UPI0028D7D7E9|nr:hypothetical protein [Streptomyces sp. DSM 40971]
MTDLAPDDDGRAAAAPFRRWLPAPSVAGFVLLLAMLFALSYAAGSSAGPVAPGMRPVHGGSGGSEPGGHEEMRGTHGLGLPAPQGAGR